MFHYLKKFKLQNSLVLLLIILQAAFMISASFIMANELNALVAKNMQAFVFWTGLDMSLWILAAVTTRFRDVRIESVNQAMLNAVREDIVNALTQMSYTNFQNRSKEDYNSWLNNDMQLLHDDGFQQIYRAAEALVSIIFSATAIIYFHWLLLTVAVILAVSLFYMPKIFEKKLKQRTEAVSAVSKEALDKSTDYLTGFEVLFFNNQLGFFKKKVMAAYEKLKLSKVNRIKTQASMSAFLMGSSVTAQILLFIVTGFLILDKQVAVGAIFSIDLLSQFLFNQTNNIANSFITARATAVLLDKYPTALRTSDEGQKAEFSQYLSVKNLSVSFSTDVSLYKPHEIHYPDFMIEKGKKYAILGDSGSGKSTLIRILLGALTDYQGQLLLDGVDYRALNLSSLHDLIGTISQFPYLFRESLQENLTIGREISPEIFEKSLNTAKAADFITDKSSVTFDDNLSGGQKERLSIARELMGNKPILIMDESTANLDKATALVIEHHILQDKRLTVLMITHHLYDESRVLVDEIIRL